MLISRIIIIEKIIMLVYMYILINTLKILSENNITLIINKIIIGCNITEKNIILSLIFSLFYII